MADNSDQTLKILLEFGLSGEDAAKAAKRIIEDTKDVTKDTAKETEQLGIKKHELKKVLMDIGNVAAPGAGRALAELAMGPVGAALALVAAFELVRHKIEDSEAELDKLADLASQPDTGGIAALKAAWDEAKKSIGEYRAALSGAGEDKDPAATELTRIKTIESAQLDSIKKVVEALAVQEMARLKAEGATPEQIANAEERNRREIADIESKKMRVEGSGALQIEQGKRMAQAGALYDAAQSAIKTSQEAALALTNSKSEINSLRNSLGLGEAGKKDDVFSGEQKRLDELQAQRDKRQQQLDEARAYGNESVAGSASRALRDMDDQLQSINDARERRRTRLQQLESGLTSQEEIARIAADKSATTQQASVTNQTRLRQLPGEINQALKLEGISQHTDAVVTTLNTRGGQLNMTLSQLASATGKTNQQTLNIVQGILNHTATLSQRMNQLEAQLRTQARRK